MSTTVIAYANAYEYYIHDPIFVRYSIAIQCGGYNGNPGTRIYSQIFSDSKFVNRTIIWVACRVQQRKVLSDIIMVMVEYECMSARVWEQAIFYITPNAHIMYCPVIPRLDF